MEIFGIWDSDNALSLAVNLQGCLKLPDQHTITVKGLDCFCGL